MKEITVLATTDNLYTVLDFVDASLREYNCPEDAASQVALAVEEIFVNIANYAYRPTVGAATVKCVVSRDPLSVVIDFLDNGKPYNPLLHADPDVSLPLEEREVGGLGILIVKKSMNSVAYEYKDGQNVLTIKKHIARPQTHQSNDSMEATRPEGMA